MQGVAQKAKLNLFRISVRGMFEPHLKDVPLVGCSIRLKVLERCEFGGDGGDGHQETLTGFKSATEAADVLTTLNWAPENTTEISEAEADNASVTCCKQECQTYRAPTCCRPKVFHRRSIAPLA